MEEASSFLVFIIMLVLIAAVSVSISSIVSDVSSEETKEVDFLSLCSEWQRSDCKLESMDFIDNLHEYVSETTLTEACLKQYIPAVTTSCGEICAEGRSIITCQDVCKNNCFSDLYVDLTVQPSGINRDPGTSNLLIPLENRGSATAYDVKVEIYNEEDLSKVVYSGVFHLSPKEIKEIVCSKSLCGSSILIRIDPLDEIDEEEFEDNNCILKNLDTFTGNFC